MKYFVISDVHGEYNPMIYALKQAGFDENNKNHCLISLGDMFDRGPQSLEVYKYLESLPRKILLMGNHEEFFLEFLSGVYSYTDFHLEHNGLDRTIISFAGLNPNTDVRKMNFNTLNKEINNSYPNLLNFMKNLNYAAKIGNNILTHAGFKNLIAIGFMVDIHSYTPKKIEEMINWEYGIDGKVKYYFGHWHASLLYDAFDMKMKKFMPFKYYDFIGIDAMTNITKKVFVEVFESDVKPVLYTMPVLLENMLLD